MATTYNEAVEQTIIASEQLHQIVNGSATTEVTVEDGSKIPTIRKSLIDNFYFKDPIDWSVGQTESVFNQLRKFTDGSLWYAPNATASNIVPMGTTPVGDNSWVIYSLDAIPKLTPQIRESLRRSYADAGYILVDGSFEGGGTLNSLTDVLIYENNGKAYSSLGPFPINIPPESNPTGYIDQSNQLLKTNVDFSSVAVMLLAPLIVGNIYSTRSYTSSGDGGAGTYKIYPAGTSADGISDHVAGNGTVCVLQPKINGIDIRSCGAVNGGDCTIAINSAINTASRFKCSVFIPAGVWVTSSVTLKDNTDIVGTCDEGGWARLADTDYTFRSVIKLKNSSNDSLIKVPSGIKLWSVRNITLDCNKANQTSYGSHGFRCYQTSGVRNFGGNISGVRVVNPKGWGIYFEGGPLNISNSFFMSGGVFVNSSDVKVSDVDFDGTDGLHCSLCITQSNSLEAWSNILCYGWGEVDQTKQVQEVVCTVNASSVITSPAGSFLYEDAPVSVPVSPGFSDSDKSPAEIFFAHNVSGLTWELYTHPFSSGSAAKVLFSGTGSITLRHGGTEAAMLVSRCTRLSFNGRIGGAKAQGAVIVKTSRHNMQVSMFNNNMRNLVGAGAVEYIGSTLCSVDSGSKLGEAAAKINYAVVYDVNSSSNDIADDVVMRETTTGVLVVDNSTADYAFRNRFNVRSRNNGVKEWISVNKDKEPGVQFITGKVTADTMVPSSTNTTIPLTALQANGVTIASNTIALPVTEGGLYKLRFVTAATSTPTAEILYQITGLGSNITGGVVRNYTPNRTAQTEVTFKAISNTTLNIQLIAFSATAFTVSSADGFSYFSVEKDGDTYVS